MNLDRNEQSKTLAASAVSPEWISALTSRVETRDASSIIVESPATGTQLGAVPACDEDAVEQAVERARDAQIDWESTAPSERGAVLERFGDLVLDHRKDILDLLQLETGKARRHGIEELLDVPNTCSYYARRGEALLTEERRNPVVPLATTATVQYRPVDVVGCISPWNYPLALSMTDVIPALIAGSAVVLKPDEKTPFTALALAELLEKAGLPENVLQVVTGHGPAAGSALIDAVDYVAFTGGTETGRLVAEQAGRNLIDCSLELGGKNPLLVLDDADVETAARGAVQACFANAGQLCLATERLYVHESVYEEFLDEFVGATRRLTLGLTFSYEPDIGSLIGDTQLERVQHHVEESVQSGATVLTGGRHRPDIGPYCYEPTILADVPADSAIASEETFGPVVTVESVPDVDTAVDAANDTAYGLNASVWTGERSRGKRVAERIDAGTVCINDGYISGWGAVDAPMGGVGDSGLGRRHGPEGLLRYLEPKTIATSRVGPLVVPNAVPKPWYGHLLHGLTQVQRTLPRVTQLQQSLPSISSIAGWFR